MKIRINTKSGYCQGKNVEVDMSFIEGICVSPFNEAELKKGVELAVSDILKSEDIELDKNNPVHKKALHDVHFHALMMLTQKKNEKESV